MSPLPYSDRGARIAFYVVLGIFLVLEQRIRLRSLTDREGTRRDRGSLLVVVASAVLGIGGACALAGIVTGAAIREARWPLFVVGLALMVVGIVLRQWSIWLLGRFFTVDVRVRPDQTVVDRGPYRWVRHPSYTGILITFAGVGIALGNWIALALAIVLPAAGLVVRIRLEERALLEGLGEPYRRYAAGRARLIPHVW